jgi:hypothetical protein
MDSRLSPFSGHSYGLTWNRAACTFLKTRDATGSIVAGVVAGALATLAQIGLWFAAGQNGWTLLLRDSRLTAALVLGEPVLSPSGGFDIRVLLAATVVHLSLSVLYAAVLLPAAKRLAPFQSLSAGAAFGALLYFFNLYGLTIVFPWFTVARGGITLMVHLVFGMAVMLGYLMLRVRPRYS